MALKVLLLRKKLESKNAELKVQREKEKDLKTREAELEKRLKRYGRIRPQKIRKRWRNPQKN